MGGVKEMMGMKECPCHDEHGVSMELVNHYFVQLKLL